MKAQDIIQAMNDIDEKYIKEALHYRPVQKSVMVWRSVAIAACAFLAVSAALMAVIATRPGSDVSSVSDVSGKYVEYDAAQESIRTEEAAEEPMYYAAQETSGYDDMMYEAAAEEVYFDAKSAAGSLDNAAPRQTLTGSTIQAATADLAETEEIAQAVPDVSDEASLYTPKIIYNVYMEMQTREYENTLSEIEQAIAANNGYSESQSLSNGSGSYRSASYTIRIPAENLDSFLAQAGEIAAVTYVDKRVEDVSEYYYDTQSRLDSAETKLARLQELLNEAEDMADIIELESAISDAQWEIDNYAGTLKNYDSQVQYSTVSISLQEVYEVITDEAPQSFGEKIAQAFSQGVKSVGTFFQNAVLWLSASWIWILIAAAVITAVILIIHHIRHRS